MKRKLYFSLCCFLFAAQIVSAQHNMGVVDDNGNVNVITISSENYATFNASDKWFSIDNGSIHDVTDISITSNCNVEFSAVSEVKSLRDTETEVGICYSKENTVPSINDNCYILGYTIKDYEFTIHPLTAGTNYYFRPYLKLENAVFYGNVSTGTALDTKPADKSKTMDGHKFVDLLLPSGILWAETNIGAKTEADAGEYFAWGETESKSVYSWETYKYYTSYYIITKYNSTDGKTVLDKEDDAAYVNWGAFCRMPTEEDITELINTANCTWEMTNMTTSSGESITGCKVTSNRNGNSIFLPAAGYMYNSDIVQTNYKRGNYWTSTHASSSNDEFSCILDCLETPSRQGSRSRYLGCPIRPVAEP